MGYTCLSCGQYHAERPTCWKFDVPAAVAALSDAEVERRVLLSSDQCILDGGTFFILGNLDIPVRGSDEFLRWSVWGTLSEQNFDRAHALWHTSGRELEKPYFSWLSNQIPGYPPSLYIKALMHTLPVGLRPRIEIIDENHPICEDQHAGISRERADELIHISWNHLD